MAAGSLLALLDDIASVLDDVSVLTKVAARKTAGVLGDDLALNAQQVSGVASQRELPVVWAVAKGSFRNKLILVPLALLISAFAPWAVTPLLMVGGAFLCYEGVEKLAHRWLHDADEEQHKREQRRSELVAAPAGARETEQAKIKGAVRTDFVLSAEIIAIALGTVAGAPMGTQVMVVSGIALAMTVGVYGFVAAIVKLDDGGLALSRALGPGAWARAQRALGAAILRAAPWLMKALSVVGTAAMFLVGGGILTHGVPALHHGMAALAQRAGALQWLLPSVFNMLLGVVVGGLLLLLTTGIQKLRQRRASAA